MKKQIKKLALTKETVRSLQDGALGKGRGRRVRFHLRFFLLR